MAKSRVSKPRTAGVGHKDVADSSSEYVGTAEAADLLDVRRPYVVQLINEGKIKATRLSARVLMIHRTEIRRYLREKRQWRMGGPRHDGSDFRAQDGH
jgi:excisionase family DNA binding protein